MAATAHTATTLGHTTAATFPTSPGAAANATDGDTFPNGGSSILVMNNTDASSHTVEVALSATVDGLAVTPRSFTVPASTVQLVKLGSVADYGSTVKVTADSNLVKLAVYAL